MFEKVTARQFNIKYLILKHTYSNRLIIYGYNYFFFIIDNSI